MEMPTIRPREQWSHHAITIDRRTHHCFPDCHVRGSERRRRKRRIFSVAR